jgi:uncharacterized protein involved in outer membrane biogenesis
MASTKGHFSFHKHRWVWISAGVIVLFLVIGLAAPLFIDADAHRQEIIDAIQSATGRQAEIGHIHVRLLPSAAAVVDGFQLSNPAGFGPGNVLSVDTVRGGLELGALLHGKIHLTSLELIHPKLILEQGERDQNNYTFSSQSPATTASAEPEESTSGFAVSEIDKVTLTKADIALQRIANPGAPPFNLFEVQNLGATLSDVTPDLTAIGQWQASANLAGLNVQMGAFSGPIVFLSGNVKLDKGAIDSTFQVQVGSVADLKGTLHIDNLNQPVTTFEISTSDFAADALLASLRKTPPSPAVKTAPTALSSSLLAQGKVSADRVEWTPYVGGNASAEIRIYGDHVEVWPASVTLYGGTLQFTARTDARQTPERFSSNIKLQNLDIGHMLAAGPPDLRGKMTGHADFNLELIGSTGGSWQSTLTGSGNFAVHDGTLPGVNLAGSLGVLAKAAGLDETRFSTLTGDLSIKDGHVNSKLIRMDASSGTVQLTGGFGLVDKSLDFNGKATVNASAMGGAPAEAIAGLLGAALKRKVSDISVPFTLSGTIAHPVFLPGKGAPEKAIGAAPATAESQLKKLFGKH